MLLSCRFCCIQKVERSACSLRHQPFLCFCGVELLWRSFAFWELFLWLSCCWWGVLLGLLWLFLLFYYFVWDFAKACWPLWLHVLDDTVDVSFAYFLKVEGSLSWWYVIFVLVWGWEVLLPGFSLHSRRIHWRGCQSPLVLCRFCCF